jgi:hypothetical protein
MSDPLEETIRLSDMTEITVLEGPRATQQFTSPNLTPFPPRGFRLNICHRVIIVSKYLQSALLLDGKRCPSDGT